jgi:hypothetical protein
MDFRVYNDDDKKAAGLSLLLFQQANKNKGGFL